MGSKWFNLPFSKWSAQWGFPNLRRKLFAHCYSHLIYLEGNIHFYLTFSLKSRRGNCISTAGPTLLEITLSIYHHKARAQPASSVMIGRDDGNYNGFRGRDTQRCGWHHQTAFDQILGSKGSSENVATKWHVFVFFSPISLPCWNKDEPSADVDNHKSNIHNSHVTVSLRKSEK